MTSPLDTRYASITKEVAEICGDMEFYITRVRVELSYLKFILKKKPELPQVVQILNYGDKIAMAEVYRNIKEIEKVTQHDVKAIEYYVRSIVDERIANLVHCGLTSQDVNSVATTVMFKNVEAYMSDKFITFIEAIGSLMEKTKGTKVMTYTHGQPAVCSFLEKEISKFYHKIVKSYRKFIKKTNELTSKFSGSIGNYTTMIGVIYEEHEISLLYEAINTEFGTNIIFSEFARQVDDYTSYIEFFQSIQTIFVSINEFATNLWLKITRGELVQTPVEGEKGSSVMPHKINPFRLEQARAVCNVGYGLCDAIIRTIGISMDSRDMSDSYALRYAPEVFGNLIVILSNVEIDMKRLGPNDGKIKTIIKSNLASLSEYIQTFLRFNYTTEITDPYKLLEGLTKGKTLTYEELYTFIDELPISIDHREYLKSLRADTVFGK
jgi:adenylosuccinate lyase